MGSVGTARIAMDATVATRTAGDLFTAPEPLFIPQLVTAGYVYAVACAPSGFLNQRCQLARAPRAMAEQRTAYEFWAGDGYSRDIARAVEFIDRGNGPSIVWNPHLGRYLSVVSEVVSNTILLRTAPAIEAPRAVVAMAKLSKFAREPITWPASLMNHGKDDDLVANDLVRDREQETRDDVAAHPGTSAGPLWPG
ncbi:MAG TPA: hypothetical protein VH165_20275 [Kofleriaceae bacterium]|nr:hypothetical protein [Kofleriaceae bacterium]